MIDQIKIYVIRNPHNNYYGKQNANDKNDKWTDELKKARFYESLGSARTVQTFIKRQDDLQTEIIELNFVTGHVIDRQGNKTNV